MTIPIKDYFSRSKARREKRLAKSLEIFGRKRRRTASGTRRKRLVAELDKLFSLYIRTRDKRRTGGACVFGCGMIEVAFHFVTRAKHSVRWDDRNAVGSCSGSNFRYEFDPHFAIRWYMDNAGREAYEKLVQDGNKVARFSLDDLERLRDELRRKIEGVCLE